MTSEELDQLAALRRRIETLEQSCEAVVIERDRLKEVVYQWGRELLVEGRLSINDFRSVMGFPSVTGIEQTTVPALRPHPLLDQATGGRG